MERRDFFKTAGVFAAHSLMPRFAHGAARAVELRNENRPGFYIRFIKPFHPVDAAKWSLRVGGLCEKPQGFRMDALKKLPRKTQISRLKCVECWSAKAEWGGFSPKALFDIVIPREKAGFLYFKAADGYYESISLEDMLRPRVLFVYEMNGRPLPDEHGAPLRLIMPFQYGYKSVKTILEMEFVEKSLSGYWERYGYPEDATIQPGLDFALDLDRSVSIETAGEPGY